jgi:uncharacterized membrane protein (DUF485 family)
MHIYALLCDIQYATLSSPPPCTCHVTHSTYSYLIYYMHTPTHTHAHIHTAYIAVVLGVLSVIALIVISIILGLVCVCSKKARVRYQPLNSEVIS